MLLFIEKKATIKFMLNPLSANYYLQQTTISNLAAISKITNKACYFMRIVCWQTILMKYHTLFLSKTRKDIAKSAAGVSGALRVNFRKFGAF